MSVVRLPRRSFSADDRYSAWPLWRDNQWVLEVFHDGETFARRRSIRCWRCMRSEPSSPISRSIRSASLCRRPWLLLPVPVLLKDRRRGERAVAAEERVNAAPGASRVDPPSDKADAVMKAHHDDAHRRGRRHGGLAALLRLRNVV
jgi:hypothetical protein